MEIRKIGEQELPQALGLCRGVYDVCVRPNVKDSYMTTFFEEYVTQENMRNLMEAGAVSIWAVFEDHMMCAMSAMQNGSHITLLYVHPAYQHKGYGSALMEAMLADAKTREPAAKVFLNAMPAWTAGFFKKNGFEAAKKQESSGFVTMVLAESKYLSYQPKAIRDRSLLTIMVIVLIAIFALVIGFFSLI